MSILGLRETGVARPRIWLLFDAADGSTDGLLRGPDGTWDPEGFVMPDELDDFEKISDSEASILLQEARASVVVSPMRDNAVAKAAP